MYIFLIIRTKSFNAKSKILINQKNLAGPQAPLVGARREAIFKIFNFACWKIFWFKIPHFKPDRRVPGRSFYCHLVLYISIYRYCYRIIMCMIQSYSLGINRSMQNWKLQQNLCGRIFVDKKNLCRVERSTRPPGPWRCPSSKWQLQGQANLGSRSCTYLILVICLRCFCILYSSSNFLLFQYCNVTLAILYSSYKKYSRKRIHCDY